MSIRHMETSLDDSADGDPPRRRMGPHTRSTLFAAILPVGAGLVLYRMATAEPSVEVVARETAAAIPWNTILTPSILWLVCIWAFLSAFFSAGEVAFLSLNRAQLRSMRESGNWFARLAERLMKRPGGLLTSILMGNSLANVLLSVTFARPLAEVFEESFRFSGFQAYTASIILTTFALLFFCEILPKVFAAQQGERFVLFAALPMYAADWLLFPLRSAAVGLVGTLFRVAGISQLPPAPFLTDDEFMTLLSEGKSSGVIEEEERQMIEGILEFSDVTVREILVPRPDIVALRQGATVCEALDIVREHEYARMPVYKEDMDHISGILYAKDLLPALEKDEMDAPVARYMRRAYFIPRTMTVADFVKMSQRLHTHMAIVVDEYGGTEGLVTLQDALREVVGDIGEEDDIEKPLFENLGGGAYRFAGNYPLDEFEKIMHLSTEDAEHTTLGGFLMALSDKILAVGDELDFSGIHFRVEQAMDKRVTMVRVHRSDEGGE